MFSKMLSSLINERKVSKTDFALYLGISRSALNDYLNDKTFMTSDKIVKTATFFGVSVGYLFGESKETDVSLREMMHGQQKQINDILLQLKDIRN